MRKTTVGMVAVAVAASFTLTSGGASAATATGSSAKHTTTSRQGLAQTDLPTFIDPAGDLAANADRVNQSWYVTAHVTAGGHRYGFLAHYLSAGDAKQGRAGSSVSITDEDTGWYTDSDLVLPPQAGLSNKPGVDIHTDNISWTGDAKEMRLRAKVPEGIIQLSQSGVSAIAEGAGTSRRSARSRT
ncbi:hypothetical protein ABZ372_53770, partial [Streptomyces sp. NPDC005921]